VNHQSLSDFGAKQILPRENNIINKINLYILYTYANLMNDSEKERSPEGGRFLEDGTLELNYRGGVTDQILLTFPKDSEGNDLKERKLYFDLRTRPENSRGYFECNLCTVFEVGRGNLGLHYESGMTSSASWRYAWDWSMGKNHPPVETKEYWKKVLEEYWNKVSQRRTLHLASSEEIKERINNLNSRAGWIQSKLEEMSKEPVLELSATR